MVVEILCSAELWPYIQSVIDMDTVYKYIKKYSRDETRSSIVTKVI
jgi:hypothetical protein